jgi:hypothetical protein
VESVAAFAWNGWQASSGISGNLGLEYAINRLAKDKNRDGRGYSFEVMRARMLYTTKQGSVHETEKIVR